MPEDGWNIVFAVVIVVLRALSISVFGLIAAVGVCGLVFGVAGILEQRFLIRGAGNPISLRVTSSLVENILYIEDELVYQLLPQNLSKEASAVRYS